MRSQLILFNTTSSTPRCVPISSVNTIDQCIDDTFAKLQDAKDTVLHRASRRVEFGAFFASLVNKQGAWTINGGESVVG